MSTADQSIASQRLVIEKALGEAAEREFVDEGVSGRVMQREGLDACLNALRAGDELVVYRLSRLGRSSAEVIRLVQDLTRPVRQGGRGIILRSVTEALDSSTPTGRAFIGILAVVFEMEAEPTRERTLAGLAAARAKGRGGGRKPSLTPPQKRQALSLYGAGERPIDIADTMSVSEPTVWRAIRDVRATRERVHGKKRGGDGLSGLVIIESTVIALAARPLGEWQPGQLHRIAALTAQRSLGDDHGLIHAAEALTEIWALQTVGYSVAVWRPERERKVSTAFWDGEGIAVLDGTWRATVTEHPSAAFIVQPSKKHRSSTAYRMRMTTASILNLPPRATRAAAAILEGNLYA